MLTEVGREVHEQGKTSTGRQMMEEYSKQITELENTLTKLKNSREGFNSRLDEVEKNDQ